MLKNFALTALASMTLALSGCGAQETAGENSAEESQPTIAKPTPRETVDASDLNRPAALSYDPDNPRTIIYEDSDVIASENGEDFTVEDAKNYYGIE